MVCRVQVTRERCSADPLVMKSALSGETNDLASVNRSEESFVCPLIDVQQIVAVVSDLIPGRNIGELRRPLVLRSGKA